MGSPISTAPVWKIQLRNSARNSSGCLSATVHRKSCFTEAWKWDEARLQRSLTSRLEWMSRSDRGAGL